MECRLTSGKAESCLLMQIAQLPAKWSGLYALAFGLIVIAWLGKFVYNFTILAHRKRKDDDHKNDESPSTTETQTVDLGASLPS